MGDKLGKMSDEEFANFQKGRTAAEAENFRDAREKARGKKGGALAVRKKEKEKTAGLGAKPKAKEGFNKQRAASGPVSGMSRTPLTYRKGEKEEDKKKEKEQKKDRKGLDLKKPLGAVAGVAKDAAGRLLSTDTRANVDTYEAQ